MQWLYRVNTFQFLYCRNPQNKYVIQMNVLFHYNLQISRKPTKQTPYALRCMQVSSVCNYIMAYRAFFPLNSFDGYSNK